MQPGGHDRARHDPALVMRVSHVPNRTQITHSCAASTASRNPDRRAERRLPGAVRVAVMAPKLSPKVAAAVGRLRGCPDGAVRWAGHCAGGRLRPGGVGAMAVRLASPDE
jgi:hypothetical protein